MPVSDGSTGHRNRNRQRRSARIFDPFVQAGKLSSQKDNGLGLAITKKYVELMGGSHPGRERARQRIVFRVEMPVRKLDRCETPASRSTRTDLRP